ncbi:AAA family ATPase [Actinophytocola oryzae]|uniref:SpoVK/Ycf46/Vps4 family AAA+-type ATPase n=1 Tax=Actinophytocola oryzae TaxID=502181 RepID=A0A4R7UW19_9PSEU|nr:AAA family ATPase [Actinophytocola oryzae]TDV40973.1 SpoVK/Ycf46/Vps4 family AAA+-type ATPase [Actinophytocola oryzae]
MTAVTTSPGRIADALVLGDDESLFVLCGPGVLDRFADPAGVVRNLESVVDHALRGHGFERVLFSRPGDQIYSLRDDLLTGSGPNGERERRPLLVSGPLSDVGHRRGPAPASLPRHIHDLEMGVVMSGALGDQVRTALVVLMAEDVLRSLSGLAHDHVNALITQAARGELRQGNLILLVFTSASLTGVRDAVREMHRYAGLEAFLERQLRRSPRRSAAVIGMAGRTELEHLVAAFELVPPGVAALAVAERDRDAALGAMVAQPGQTILNWSAGLGALARSGAPLSEATLREAGLVDGPAGGEDALTTLAARHGTSALVDRITDIGDLLVVGRGRNVEPPSLHLVFNGSPGTGKTTAAHLVGHAYRTIGALRRGHTHAVSGSQVIGQFVGQTTHLVDQAVGAALDGVLFIDEAYQLSDDERFGREAITTLVRNMDELRDRLVVIVAGYQENMEQLLASNAGLASRFGDPIDFPDFSDDELADILAGFLAGYGIEIDDTTRALLLRVVAGVPRPKTFGNARTMRQLSEQLAVRWMRTRESAPGPFREAHLTPAARRYLDAPGGGRVG